MIRISPQVLQPVTLIVTLGLNRTLSPLPPPPSLWWYQLIGCRLKVRLYISVNKVMTVFSFFFLFVCFLLFLTPLLNMSLFGHASASCLLVVPCMRSVGDVHEDLGFSQ